jgi:hypothetical protein
VLFLEAEGNFARFFFIAFLNSPYVKQVTKRPKTRLKKIEPNNQGRKKKKTDGKKTDGKKKTFFVMSPDGFFPKQNRVFLTPLVAKCPKTR